MENGVLRAFLYDLQTAGLAGKETTGSGFRSLGSLPSPSPTSWVLSEGSMSIEEMISDVKEGLLIDQIMGAWAGNVLSGDFSGNVHLGFKIENGKLVGRVKDTMVAGNAFEILKNDVVAFGSAGEWVNGSLKAPAVYLSSLSVSGKG